MSIDRYHRQRLLPEIGTEGQARISAAKALLVGCGALGSVIADQLVRAGIGELRIADRDVVELTNLQRQVLFDEADVREQTPKAAAAARRLSAVNSDVRLVPLVVDVHNGNVEEIAGLMAGGERVDVILDGTDNVQTRYLLNDVAVKHQVPWVYGACVGTEGRCMAMRPPTTACLRCVFPQPPGAGELPTCDTAGVLGSAAAVVASLQVAAAIKLLVSQAGDELITVDPWRSRFHVVSLIGAKRSDCVTCGQRRFDFLNGGDAGRSVSLCGRNAVQVRPSRQVTLDLSDLAVKLAPVGDVQRTPYLLRCHLNDSAELCLTVFPDGRAIIQGTADLRRATSLYARYVGD